MARNCSYVSYKHSIKRWEVLLYYKKTQKKIYLGTFTDKNEAIRIRDVSLWYLYKDESLLYNIKNKTERLPAKQLYALEMRM